MPSPCLCRRAEKDDKDALCPQSLSRGQGHVLEGSKLKEPKEVQGRGFHLPRCRALSQTKVSHLEVPCWLPGSPCLGHLLLPSLKCIPTVEG